MLTHQFISELIAATRTDTGHTVRCRLDQATYPKGIIVTDDQLAAVNITRGAFHGEWNYTIAPRTTELVEPSPEPIAVIIAVRPLRFRRHATAHSSRPDPPQAPTEKRPLLCRGASRERASPVRFIGHRAAKCGAFVGSVQECGPETDRVAEGPVPSEPVSQRQISLFQRENTGNFAILHPVELAPGG